MGAESGDRKKEKEIDRIPEIQNLSFFLASKYQFPVETRIFLLWNGPFAHWIRLPL